MTKSDWQLLLNTFLNPSFFRIVLFPMFTRATLWIDKQFEIASMCDFPFTISHKFSNDKNDHFADDVPRLSR